MAKKWEAMPRWHFRSQRCCTFNILCVLQVSLPVLLWFGVDPCGPIYNAAVVESSFQNRWSFANMDLQAVTVADIEMGFAIFEV